jgi:hypothetical protein
MTIIPDGFAKKVSQCKGDSGTGVFLVKSDGLAYGESPEKFPEEIALKDGHPIVVGLVSHHPVQNASQMNARCGLNVGAPGFDATRVGFFHDWIFAKVREMR